MAKCDYCGSGILFGGARRDDLRFCNEHCLQAGALMTIASQIPETELSKRVKEVHRGACPRCGGKGPVDVQTSYRVWSIVLMTSSQSRPQICCRTCGVKAKLGDAAFSGLLGWWGIPWGLLMTPVQVTRNLAGLLSSPHPHEPSDELRRLVSLNLAAALVEASRAQEVEVT